MDSFIESGLEIEIYTYLSRAFRLDGLTYAVTVVYLFFYHYCFIGTNINKFLLQGIYKVLSIEQKETLYTVFTTALAY